MIMTRYDSWHNLSKFMRTWSATPSLFSTMIVLYYTELIIFFAIWNDLHFYFLNENITPFSSWWPSCFTCHRSFQVSLSVWGHSPQVRQNQITYTQTSIVSTDLRWTPQISWHCLIMLFTPTKEKETEKIQMVCFSVLFEWRIMMMNSWSNNLFICKMSLLSFFQLTVFI